MNKKQQNCFFLLAVILVHSVLAEQAHEQMISADNQQIHIETPVKKAQVVALPLPAAVPVMSVEPSVTTPQGPIGLPAIENIQQKAVPVALPVAQVPAKAAPSSTQPPPVSSAVSPKVTSLIEPAAQAPAKAQPRIMKSIAPMESGPKQVKEKKKTLAPEITPVRVSEEHVPPATEKKPKKSPAENLLLESEPLYQEGIDTLHEGDVGNWYLKRSAWKKAGPRYNTIRKLIKEAESIAKELIEKQRLLELDMEQFYEKVGFEQGHVVTIFDNLLDELNKRNRGKPEGLSQEEFKELDEVETKKEKDLEALKANFETIRKISSDIRNTILGTLVEQVGIIRNYQEEALNNYYKISEILDDKKAKDLLNTITNFTENIQAVLQWMKGPLASYVNQSTHALKELMTVIQNQLDDLQTRGISIKKRESEEEKKQEEERQKKLKEEAEAKKKAAGAKAQTIWQRIGGWFKSLWSFIANALSTVFRFIIRPKVGTK